MSGKANENEGKIFEQEISVDDLDAASGGAWQFLSDDMFGPKDADRANCTQFHHRPMYGPNGFPNCAATVESASDCNRNDGCYDQTVHYDGMRDCHRAWE